MFRDWSIPRQGYFVFLAAAALCILAIVSLSQTVSRDLTSLESASSDNVQWTLSQAEVEYLEFLGAVHHSLLTKTFEPAVIRLEFDIFYSRITTFETGSLYHELRQTPEYQASIRPIRAFLDAQVPLIDRLDTLDLSELAPLEDAAERISEDVRRLSNSGLFYFAELSDMRRNSIGVSLRRLALLTTTLIGAMALLAYYLHRLSRASQRSRADLQSAYTRMNTVVNTALDAVIVTDRFGHILEFNASAENIFGYRVSDLKGKKLTEYLLPAHLRDAHTAGVKRMNETGETHVIGHGRVKLEAMRSSGEVFPCELALESAGEGDEKIVIGFVRDISAQVEAEAALIDARDSALAGEKAKSDFLAVMTHEIRTPLNGVLGNLSLLAETRLTEKQNRYVQNMDISARQLMRHVDSVLDIARFESGQIANHTGPVHLGNLLQEIIDGQSGAAEARGNVLQRSWVGPRVSWVTADAGRLQQVLLNLVGNAIKFTQNGRISLEAERMSPPGDPAGIEIEFRISDTGVGISETDQTRIFEDFQTADASFQRESGGTGLGLGIARRLVESMNGEIGVESEPGEGSVFWVRLRLPEALPPQSHPKPSNRAESSGGLDILAVEDNEINLHLLRERLILLGHRVHTATNGLEGVQAATKRTFDLILMDISMPVMDGLEASRRIRSGGGPSANVPIVALSANVLPEMRHRITEAGMSGFLGKPMEHHELMSVLSEVIQTPPSSPAPSASPDESVLKSLHARFESEVNELMTWLEAVPQDRAALAARCHKTAGSAAAFGHLELRDALVQIEHLAQSNAEAATLEQAIRSAAALWSDVDTESDGTT